MKRKRGESPCPAERPIVTPSQATSSGPAVMSDIEKRRERSGMYCAPCKMWLNGITQWLDHKETKKHSRICREMGLDVQTVTYSVDECD